MALEGLVAQLLTPTSVALNIGSQNGVDEGDTVKLVDVVDVKDPLSGELLGRVSVPRLEGKITQVRERLSVAKVTTTYTNAKGQRFLKTMTDDPDLADYRTTFVYPGMAIEVESGLPF